MPFHEHNAIYKNYLKNNFFCLYENLRSELSEYNIWQLSCNLLLQMKVNMRFWL
jgi:hypothetical protein